MVSSTKTDSKFPSVLRGCCPLHPICKNQPEQPSLLIYLHPSQFSQVKGFPRSRHRHLNHGIPICLCSWQLSRFVLSCFFPLQAQWSCSVLPVSRIGLVHPVWGAFLLVRSLPKPLLEEAEVVGVFSLKRRTWSGVWHPCPWHRVARRWSLNHLWFYEKELLVLSFTTERLPSSSHNQTDQGKNAADISCSRGISGSKGGK